MLSEETGISVEDLTENEETWQELLNTAEKSKYALSTRESRVEVLKLEGERLKVELTREKFEQINSHLLERTLSLTDAVLERAREKGYGNIDKLLMVGGSSFMPQVESSLKARFPTTEIQLSDPNQAVAKGAALFGYKCFLDEQIKIAIAEETGEHINEIDLDTVADQKLVSAQEKVAVDQGIALPSLQKLTDTRVTNVTSKSFGLVVQINDEGGQAVNNLIVVNDKVPATITREFYTSMDNQENVNLRCIENLETEGPDGTIPLDPDQEIGNAILEFGRELPIRSPVEVTFSLSADGLLSVHGKDLTTEREIFAEFQTKSILSKEELEEKREHNLAIDIL